jgi:predicted ATPase/DNA-binding winged helix-turn-helix (wHTH) protein
MLRSSGTGPVDAFAFGRFRLLPRERQLLDGDQPVRLGGRAFDLLQQLVDRAGEVLTRAELEASVWQKTVVEETSLRVHIAALRKALGEGNGGERFILNVPGRGYSFVAPVARHARPPSSTSAARPQAMPVRLTRMVGRSEAVTAVCELLSRHRMVTIAGAGGMGKTTLAIAVAEQLLPTFADGVCFVDLAPIADARLVPGAIATALGVATSSDDPISALAAHVRGRHLLLLLDNCEHVVEVAAAMSETLQRHSRASVLATSREPLGAEGEWIYRLSSLETPGPDQIVTASNATAYAAIDLFVDRASGSGDTFEVSNENASLIGEICRRLDGIPLAIELAAAHVQYLGVREVATHLDDRFALLTRGRRTAPPRHRTLSAMLDWSYELLGDVERRVLCRLAVFRATFSVDSGVAVAANGGDQERLDVVQAIVGLVAKSLIVADPTGPMVRYRLLETTRSYALRRLEESGDLPAASRRHALQMQHLLREAETIWTTMSPAQWVAGYCQGMDDIRAALDWCFSDEGDVLLGAGMTADSVLQMYELGFLPLNEYRQLVDRALTAIASWSPAQPALEMRLNSTLCLRNWASTGPAGGLALVRRTLQLAEQSGDMRHRVTALYGSWVSALGAGDYRLSREALDRIREIGGSSLEDAAELLCDRMSALTSHFLGEHAAARAVADRALRHEPIRMPLGYSSPIPLRVLMQIVLARADFLVGRFDRAVRVAGACLEEAAQAHPIALIQTLAVAAIPIAFWRGDAATASTLVVRLAEVAERHGSDYWRSFAARFHEALALRGWADPNVRSRSASFAGIRAANALEADCIGTLVNGWVSPESEARAERGDAGWCAPEILRNIGENLRAAGNAEDAEARFVASISLARSQDALAWQLRAATSLAELWAEQGRVGEARQLLNDVYSKLTEGLDTADPLRAKQLLDRLDLSK